MSRQLDEIRALMTRALDLLEREVPEKDRPLHHLHAHRMERKLERVTKPRVRKTNNRGRFPK